MSVVQVRGAAFAPEFGLSAGAVTTVETQRAGDAWHITVNDFELRPRRRAGEFRGIESWTPRFTFGGPLVKGKVNFLESVQYEYSQTRVFGLPAFERLDVIEGQLRSLTGDVSNAVTTAAAAVKQSQAAVEGVRQLEQQSIGSRRRTNE